MSDNIRSNSVRKIKVFNQEIGRPKTITTCASTWGELKQELHSHISGIDSMVGVIRGEDTTLSLPTAKLPAGEFIIYLFPEKTKSGRCHEHNTEVDNEELQNLIEDVERQVGDLKELVDRLQVATNEIDATIDAIQDELAPEDEEEEEEEDNTLSTNELAEEYRQIARNIR